jgi:hypothetical protein
MELWPNLVEEGFGGFPILMDVLFLFWSGRNDPDEA